MAPFKGYKRKNSWTDEEIEILIKNHASKSRKELLCLINRSETALVNKINELLKDGLIKTKSPVDYSAEEDEYIKENYQFESAEKMEDFLGRKYLSISNRARKLGVKRATGYQFTEDQKKHIEASYLDGNSVETIKDQLGGICSVGPIRLFLAKKGIIRTPHESNVLNGESLKGRRVGMLVLVNRLSIPDKKGRNITWWECRCDCGSFGKFRLSGLSGPRVWENKNCGCVHPSALGYEEISGSYLCSLRWRAKVGGMQCSVEPAYIWGLYLKQNRKCALSGMDIHFEAGKGNQTASLDRIDSKEDYVEGNVQWVHKWINIMKTDLSDDEFIDFCRKVAEFNKDRVITLDLTNE